MCDPTLFPYWISHNLVRFEALSLGCLFAVGITLIHIKGPYGEPSLRGDYVRQCGREESNPAR